MADYEHDGNIFTGIEDELREHREYHNLKSMSIGCMKYLQYFKISKVACVTQKTGCFEYVTRLYPNDTQTHHRRPLLDAQK